jgi:methyl-accepting chemotaxis protein
MRGSWTFSRRLALSTKQQTSAVEQVHVAIAGLARTTRETEAGASQTLQTSSQLTSLSTSLTRLVQTT